MIRVIDAELCGKQCALAMSVGAMKALSEKYGSQQAALGALSPGEGGTIFDPPVMDAVTQVAGVLLEWGAKHRRETDGEERDNPSLDWLMTVMGQKDYLMLYGAVISAIRAGTERLVEAEEDPKNAGATRGN